jgi:hypothetical protein
MCYVICDWKSLQSLVLSLDYVLLEQNKRDKWSTAYEPAFYNIFAINGSTVGARRVSNGREIHRDASKFKLANALIQEDDENVPPPPPPPFTQSLVLSLIESLWYYHIT